MQGAAYVCGICGHMFRAADDVPRDTRSLMCPACGSIDVNIVPGHHETPVVMRAGTLAGANRHDIKSPGSG